MEEREKKIFPLFFKDACYMFPNIQWSNNMWSFDCFYLVLVKLTFSNTYTYTEVYIQFRALFLLRKRFDFFLSLHTCMPDFSPNIQWYNNTIGFDFFSLVCVKLTLFNIYTYIDGQDMIVQCKKNRRLFSWRASQIHSSCGGPRKK